jgi:ABC-type polysaccharide/polyol phosphate transport system ATPase subunit
MIDLNFEHVSKIYRIRQDGAAAGGARPSLAGRARRLLGRGRRDFWALRDVSFAARRGEALGIIGHNGAGKSTILKILSGITAPTAGEITIRGRLSALIEVGSGFHPELTGVENIYLNGSILGMTRREITSKLDSIVEFAGVRQFIDTPVKRYSSGMYVRLGFSIIAHLNPDVLLLDEVLAVGDVNFQAKCIGRIIELKQSGVTTVFISHDLSAVERLCDRVLLMRQGEIVADGPPAEVIAKYQDAGSTFVPSAPPGSGGDSLPRRAEITSLAFYDAAGQPCSNFRTGDPLVARVGYTAHERIAEASFGLFFYSPDRELYCQFSTAFSGERLDLEPGAGTVEFFCPALGLHSGLFNVDATIDNQDWQYQCAMLRVDPGKSVRGRFYMPHTWQAMRAEPAEVI